MGGSGWAEVASNRIGLAGVTGSGGFIGIHVAGRIICSGEYVGNMSGGAISASSAARRSRTTDRRARLGGGYGILDRLGPRQLHGERDRQQRSRPGQRVRRHRRRRDPGPGGWQRWQPDPRQHRRPVDGLFIDLEGAHGPGNGLHGPNAAVNAPKVKQITATAISGTAGPSGQVRIYRSASPKGDFPEGLKKLVGTKDVKPDGTWKLKVPGAGVKKSWVSPRIRPTAPATGRSCRRASSASSELTIRGSGDRGGGAEPPAGSLTSHLHCGSVGRCSSSGVAAGRPRRH